MRVKILTLRYSATLGGFDDGALAELIRDKELIAFREHFFVQSEIPHLACVVSYQDAVMAGEVLERAREIQDAARAAKADAPPRRSEAPAALDERQRALWNTLREWRSRTAREEGVPPYVLLRNDEITAIVAAMPESPTALGHVPGIGPSRVKRHGASILALLHGSEAREAQASQPLSTAQAPAASPPRIEATEAAP